jgi:hypothetical protein
MVGRCTGIAVISKVGKHGPYGYCRSWNPSIVVVCTRFISITVEVYGKYPMRLVSICINSNYSPVLYMINTFECIVDVSISSCW